MMPCNTKDGLLLIDKPMGKTSHDVVNMIRRAFGVKKVGHGGTLDPIATGLLIMGIGRGTKVLQRFLGASKAYTVGLRLGVSTDTQDTQGRVIHTMKDVSVTAERFEQACHTFSGPQKHLPPMYSAKKKNGTALYVLARKGISIPREPVNITVYALDILSFDGCRAELAIACSSGTYVRTLCSDIGDVLGVGAVMTHLVRTKVGDFHVDDALTLTELMALPAAERFHCLLSLDSE